VLVKAQMKLAKSPKGVVIRAKALKIVEHIHERISNKREDFVQKVSLNLVRTYDLITFEDLNVKEMTKNHCLAKHISDASWRELIAVMIYKAEWACKRLELVNPRNKSQICSGCGRIVKKNYLKGHIVVRFVVLIEVIMLLLTFSDWDNNLFVKPINIIHFSDGSSHDHDPSKE
jgi:IS605 OrfB family transposase